MEERGPLILSFATGLPQTCEFMHVLAAVLLPRASLTTMPSLLE